MISSSEFLAYMGPNDVAYPVANFAGVTRVLEVGAGAGSGTLHLLKQLPDTHVVCLEPDDASRNALLWRLIDHPNRNRVSVLPLGLEYAAKLGTFDLAVANHVICQIPIVERPGFWRALAGSLTPSGLALIDSHLGRTSAGPVERRLSGTGANGDFNVSRWFSSAAKGADLHIRNEYVFADTDGSEIYRYETDAVVEVVDESACRQQILDAGLVIENLNDEWLRLTHAAT